MKKKLLSLLLVLVLVIGVTTLTTMAAEETSQVSETEEYKFCKCGGYLDEDVAKAITHKCADVQFVPLTQADVNQLLQTEDSNAGVAYTLDTGNYILTEDVTLDKTLLIPRYEADGKTVVTVNLNLNGHTLTGAEALKYTMYARGNLNISDSSCDPTAENVQWGSIVGSSNPQAGGSALYAASTSKVFLYSGEIRSGAQEDTVAGPLAVGGTFHLCGGQVVGYKTSSNGGAIVINDSGNLTIWGGTVVGGEAKNGGAIAVSDKDGKKPKITIRTKGVVTGGTATSDGGNIYLTKYATLEVKEGGIIQNGSAAASTGGNVYANAGTVKVTGGTIANGQATYGGNIGVSTDNLTVQGLIEITSGTISGGSAKNGGNIHVNSKRPDADNAYLVYNVNITGGQIIDGAATQYADNIYMTYGHLTVGNAAIKAGKGEGVDIYVNGNKYTTVKLDGQVDIGVMSVSGTSSLYAVELGSNFSAVNPIGFKCRTLPSSGNYYIFAKDSTTDLNHSVIGNSFYLVDMENYQITIEANTDKTMYTFRARPTDVFYSCRCGGNLTAEAAKAIGHKKCEHITFTALTTDVLAGLTVVEGDKLAGECYSLVTGNYILTDDLNIDKALLIPADATVRLNLNGHNLIAGDGINRAVVARGKLHLSDSAYDHADENAQWGQIIGSATATTGGTALYIAQGDKIESYIYGGGLSSGITGETSIAGVVGISGTLRMIGGEINGITTKGDAGAVIVNDNGIFHVYGGTIYGGNAKRGGAIYANNTERKQQIFVRGDALITGGTALAGGNIYAGATAQVYVYGGTIENGGATGAASGTLGGGGNIYAAGQIKITGGTVTGGTATRTQDAAQAYGGNIYQNGSDYTMTIENGIISGGTAVTGGNIFCRGNFTMSDGTISDGTATSGMAGNVRLVSTGTVNITGGTISNGYASNQGGNLSLVENKAENVISNVKFIGGTSATQSGGSLYISKCPNVTITNIEIDGGTTLKASGAALFIGGVKDENGALMECTISDSVIKNGSAANNGGNIYVDASANLTLTNCTVTGGGATDGGNIYALGLLTINGGEIADGTATQEGGNIYTTGLNMTDGTVSGGVSASYGGSIYLSGDSEISGGLIKDGVSTSTSRSGGNICVSGKSTLTITGGTISGGQANEGGNISVRDGSTVNIQGGTISGGEAANHGGNIVAYTTLNISGGDIFGGKAAMRGGNISTYGNYGKITITGGQIRDGILTGKDTDEEPDGIINQTAADLYGANISMLSATGKPLELTILGGTIGGLGQDSLDVSSVHIQSSGDEVTTTVGGTAVIDSLRLGTDRMLTIHEDGFAEGASIGVERFEIAGLFAPGAAAENAQYFHATESGVSVQADETGLILVSENPYWAFNSNNKQVAGAKTIAEAMAIEGATIVRLVQDHTTDEVVTGDVYLDLYGNNLTGLTVNGNLYAVDYQTNAYEEGVAGNLINFTGNVNKLYKADSEKFSVSATYLAHQAQDGSWSFHRVSVAITHTSLDAANDALGFKATVSGDSVVQKAVTGFGFDLGIQGGSVKTYTTNDNHGTDGVFTLRVKNIMKNNGGEISIIGAPFILFGEDAVTGAEKSTTMKDTIVAINEAWDSFNADQQAAVKALYDQYADIMSAWLTDNKINPPVVEETPAA